MLDVRRELKIGNVYTFFYVLSFRLMSFFYFKRNRLLNDRISILF